MKKIWMLMLTMTLFVAMAAYSDAILTDNLDGTITDSDTGLMWLQDANHAMGRFDQDGPDDGLILSSSAADFVAQMNAGNISGGNFGHNDWRLPTTLQPDPGCSSQSGGLSFGYNCTGSEMGHLFYLSLGDVAGGPLTNIGPFLNLQPSFYWSSLHDLLEPLVVWGFDFGNGFQEESNTLGYALLVRDAGVAVPEPSTFLLLGAGLAGVGLLRRKLRK